MEEGHQQIRYLLVTLGIWMGAIGLEVHFAVARRVGLPVAPEQAIGTRCVTVSPSVRAPRRPGSHARLVIQITGCRIDVVPPLRIWRICAWTNHFTEKPYSYGYGSELWLVVANPP